MSDNKKHYPDLPKWGVDHIKQTYEGLTAITEKDDKQGDIIGNIQTIQHKRSFSSPKEGKDHIIPTSRGLGIKDKDALANINDLTHKRHYEDMPNSGEDHLLNSQKGLTAVEIKDFDSKQRSNDVDNLPHKKHLSDKTGEDHLINTSKGIMGLEFEETTNVSNLQTNVDKLQHKKHFVNMHNTGEDHIINVNEGLSVTEIKGENLKIEIPGDINSLPHKKRFNNPSMGVDHLKM